MTCHEVWTQRADRSWSRQFAVAILGLMIVVVCSVPAAAVDPLDQNGERQQWKGAPGALTVIDFAASWCLPCVKSLPRLDQLAKDFPDVKFIVVSVDKREAGRDFLVNELKLELPVLWDADYMISNHYEPEGMPTTIVLDENGKEVHRHTGFSERQWSDLVSLVQADSKRGTQSP